MILCINKLNGQNDCTVTRVAELVKDEVGFDVNLVKFNTKCIQMVDSDATQGIDFWKSSRNVLAVNTQMLDKAFGKKKPYSAAIELTKDEEDDTEDEEAQETMPPSAYLLYVTKDYGTHSATKLHFIRSCKNRI